MGQRWGFSSSYPCPLERISKKPLAASERYFATRLGVETEHSRVLCEGFDNDAWA